MADPETTEPDPEVADESAGGASKGRKLVAIVVVIISIMVNLGIVYAIVPTAQEVEAQKRLLEGWESKSEADEKEGESKEDETSKTDDTQQEEPLGDFNMSAFQPLSSTTIRIDFKLWGIVAVDETGDFREQYDANENRIREQILIIMRSADIDDLSEAGLGLIKRKILDKTNHLLSKPFLQSVLFSNFSFVEQ